MRDPIVVGAGIAPDVSIVDGIVYVAYGARPDALILVCYSLDGAELMRAVLPFGFDQSFPRFSGEWLVYRMDEAHGYAAVAHHVKTGLRWVYGPAGGTYSLAVNADQLLVAYEWTYPDWRVTFGSLANGKSALTDLPGAPDGLDTLVSDTQVTLRKDTRGDVPDIWSPVYAGDLTVGMMRDSVQRPEGGIGVQLAGDVLRMTLPGQNAPDPRCATDGHVFAIVCWNPVRLILATAEELRTLTPAADVTWPPEPPDQPPVPPKPPIPPIPPRPPATRFPAARRLRGAPMRVYLKSAGKYVGVEPSTPEVVYANREHPGAWEEVELTDHGGGLFDARFVSADRVLSIQPDGKLETRKAGTFDAYEQVRATTQPEGLDILYRASELGVLDTPLTIEAIA
jgi:hypothetical protein